MTSRKLAHAEFWERMDRATRHVGKYPEWVKGSPVNERPASPACRQTQTDRGKSNGDSNKPMERIPFPTGI